MPLYEFKDTETEEIFEVMMSFSEAEEFMEKHPQIKRYYSKAPGLITGKEGSTLKKAGDGWKEVQDKIKQGLPKRYADNIRTK